MRKHWPCWLTVVLALLQIPALAAQEPPSDRPLNLAKVLADPQAVSAAHDAEREKLEKSIAAAAEGVERAKAELALANWCLGVSAAHPATRWLLGLDTEADRRAIVRAAEAAGKYREQALASLNGTPATDESSEAKRHRRELTNSAEILAGFEAIYRAADLPVGEKSHDAWREASRGLAVTRETEDPDLSACALMWQAFAWDKGGRRDRALDSLPDALAAPQRLPFDLISRLMRCRMLADDGRHPAAVALTIKIADASRTWLRAHDKGRSAFRRTTRILQHRFLEQWIGQPANATQPAASENLKRVLADVAQTLGNEGSAEAYYLESAIPILVKPPDIKAPEETNPSESETPSGTKPAAPDESAPGQDTPAEGSDASDQAEESPEPDDDAPAQQIE